MKKSVLSVSVVNVVMLACFSCAHLRHRYNYYTGWCAAADGILLYVDNLLDGQKGTDNLVMDKCVIHFPE